MKKLSETLKELGIAKASIQIQDANGNQTYYESSTGYWVRTEYDANGKRTYCEHSNGFKSGTPRSAKTNERNTHD